MRDSSEKGGAALDYLRCGILALALESEDAFKKTAEYSHLFRGTDYGGIMDAMLALKGDTGAAPSAAELAEVLEEADQAVLERILKRAEKISGSSGSVGGSDGEDGNEIDEYHIKLEIATLKVREAELIEAAGTDAELLKELMETQKRIKFLENKIRSGRRGE